MDLNDLLAEVEGIGTDQYVPSNRTATAMVEPAEVMELPAMNAEPVPSMPEATITVEQVMGTFPPAPAPQFGTLDMVLDLEIDVEVELGATRLPLKALLNMQPGTELALNQRPEDPVVVYVHGRPVAHGEVLVVDDMLAVKVTEILAVSAVMG